MSEQDKVTLLGVVFSVIVVLSVLVISAKDVYGWFYRKLTKRAFDGAKRCPECGEGVVGFLGKCEMCGYNPPRK